MGLRAAGGKVKGRGLGARRSAFGSCVLVFVLVLGGFVGCRGRETTAKNNTAPNKNEPTARQNTAPKEEHHDRILPGGVALPAVGLSTNGYAGDSVAISEGAQLFTTMNCDGCHGGGATGWVGPSLSDGRWRYGGSDTEIFRSIYYGQRYGMPAYGGVLQPPVIWKIVAYLKSLPPPKDVPTESW